MAELCFYVLAAQVLEMSKCFSKANDLGVIDKLEQGVVFIVVDIELQNSTPGLC